MAAVTGVAASGAVAKPAGKRKLALGLGALGVVFGDIGTSPLYAFQQIFAGPNPIVPDEHRVFGAVSLIFWTLTLIVSVKYVLIVMRADNDGEGGIMALAALAVAGTMRTGRRKMVIMGLGILGAALFYGDGMITPAVSVLSAVEGLEVAKPSLAAWVVPIAVVVLLALFAVQRRGTGRIGAVFGPVMLVWFFAIGLFGLLSILATPRILEAVNPMYAVTFFQGEPWIAFLALGSVVLCVTGAEALYADMGQFGRGPIRLSWFLIATPALYLNYFGQAALVVRNRSNAANPFYLMIPDGLQLPMVLLATLATVIASQAVISGAFSMTVQAVRLDYLPRVTVRHTSDTERGQVYVPVVNWALGIAVVVLVIAFRSSSSLASAYGIAVTGTFVITTCLITIVALQRWRVSPWIIWPIFTVFFVIDLSFFSANLTKFDHGGWFPLLSAVIVFSLLTTWRRGRMLLLAKLAKLGAPLAAFAEVVNKGDYRRIPGSAVYLAPDRSSAPAAPPALVRHVTLLGVLAETTVTLRLVTAETPWVAPANRVVVTQEAPGFWQVIAHYGFKDRPNVPDIMKRAALAGLPLDPATCTYVLNFVTVEPSKSAHMMLRRQQMYALMQRMTSDPVSSMKIPPNRVLGVG
ncbi:MAG: KUP/HAK/KT family potassium transporter, partial [Actinomycetes bacterium]